MWTIEEMNVQKAPTFEQLAQQSRRKTERTIDYYFEHGPVSFKGRVNKKRADIEVDLQRTSMKMRPETTEEFMTLHKQYMSRFPEVTRGGAISHFGPAAIHFHVRIEDADEWIQNIYSTVSDPSKLAPLPSLEESLEEMLASFGSRKVSRSSDDVDEGIDTIEEIVVGEVATERLARIGQNRFSRLIRNNYRGKCCFPNCDVDDERLLIGAHIIRWVDSTEHRGHASNGLCLCSLHDRAFENGLFTLTLDFCIEVGLEPSKSTWRDKHLKPFHGKKIRIGTVSPSITAIEAHRIRHGF